MEGDSYHTLAVERTATLLFWFQISKSLTIINILWLVFPHQLYRFYADLGLLLQWARTNYRSEMTLKILNRILQIILWPQELLTLVNNWSQDRLFLRMSRAFSMAGGYWLVNVTQFDLEKRQGLVCSIYKLMPCRQFSVVALVMRFIITISFHAAYQLLYRTASIDEGRR